MNMTWYKIRYLYKYLYNVHSPGPEKDIIMFATARSGSTYLSELISTQPKIKFISEPFNIRHPYVGPVLRGYGIHSWADILPKEGHDAFLIRYFSDIRKNKIPLYNHNPLDRSTKFFTNRICYKVLHAAKNRINFLRDNLSIHPLILIRHPLAVAISRLKAPTLEYLVDNEEYASQFGDEELRLVRRIIKRGDSFEMRIVDWCMQNKPMVYCPDKKGWCVITYEDLVLNFEDACKKIAEQLRLPDLGAMMKKRKRPSKTVSQSDSETQLRLYSDDGYSAEWLVRKWSKKVTQNEVDRAYDIIEAFGMDIYKRGEFMVDADRLVS